MQFLQLHSAHTNAHLRTEGCFTQQAVSTEWSTGTCPNQTVYIYGYFNVHNQLLKCKYHHSPRLLT